jgi:deazaflavin-dependent oxidoreductase (nitroreductase family)
VLSFVETEDTMSATSQSTARYLAPGVFTRRLFNPMVALLTKRGVSLWGSRVLEVRGRASGELRSTVVNVLEPGDGHTYLVAPRGHTQWVRNLRAAGQGTLRVGRRSQPFTAVELADDDKVDVLRAYLERWAWEVGQFFDGIDASSSDADLRAVAPGFPAFRLASN